MSSLDEFAAGKLRQLEAKGQRRQLAETDPQEGIEIRRDGRTYLSFCSNDYLNLSRHPETVKAAQDALARYGTGAGASRLVTGNHPLFAALEARLAAFKGAEDCVVFGSGYLANLGIVPSLTGPGDLILADELSHACLLAGARLSGADVAIFAHNDMAGLEALLREHRGPARHCLILTDGVFSMDGDLAPLDAVTRLATKYDAWAMTDDAHGLGVLGGGRGSSFIGGAKAPRKADIPLQMGTLSKAIGSYGGYLCASKTVCDFLRTRARTLIYSTGLPPASVAASLAALDLIEADPLWAASPVEKARRFTRTLGVPEAQSPIVPLILGDELAALAASRLLADEGFLVTAIRPPTVPEGTARLRFTFTAAHDDRDIDRLAGLVRDKILPRRAAE